MLNKVTVTVAGPEFLPGVPGLEIRGSLKNYKNRRFFIFRDCWLLVARSFPHNNVSCQQSIFDPQGFIYNQAIIS